MKASGIVLAGGASRRMGRDKAWIEFQGRPLVEHVVERLAQVVNETIIVTTDREPYERRGWKVVSDLLPGCGPLGGIFSGLAAVQYEAAFVAACDMPFLSPALLEYMLSLAADFDVVTPSAPDPSKPRRRSGTQPTAKDSDLHPLHAVYTRRCREPMRARLDSGDRRMISFYPDVRVRVVTPSEIDRFDPRRLSLFNANNPEQLALAEQIAASRPSEKSEDVK